MFNSPILDLALALCFMYFILGLIVSTVHEFIYSVLGSKRSKYLKDAINSLFFDQGWKTLAANIFSNSNIQALKSQSKNGKTQEPSYIPAKSFAYALLDQFRSGNNLLDMNQIRAILTDDQKAANAGISGDVRKVLLSLFERAQGDLQQFQKHIETFFNDAMDRASGIYKRSTQKAILVISLVVAVGLNADTINTSKTLWSNPNALKKTADNITDVVNHIKNDSGKITINATGDSVIINTSLDTTVLSKDTTKSSERLRVIDKQVLLLKNTGIPIGWTKDNLPANDFWGILVKIVGLILTALALMLGAPFWFDMINKIVNIRGTGKKPDDTNTNKKSGSDSDSTSTKAVG
jgi:hypothetical protein